eukprot:UN31037
MHMRNRSTRCFILCVQCANPTVISEVNSHLKIMQDTHKFDDNVLFYSAKEKKFVPNLADCHISGPCEGSELHQAINCLNKSVPFSKRVLDLIWISDGSINVPDAIDVKQRSLEWYCALKRVVEAEKADVHVLATDDSAVKSLNSWTKVLKIYSEINKLEKFRSLLINLNLQCWRGKLYIDNTKSKIIDNNGTTPLGSSQKSSSTDTPVDSTSNQDDLGADPHNSSTLHTNSVCLKNIKIRLIPTTELKPDNQDNFNKKKRFNSVENKKTDLWKYPVAKMIGGYSKRMFPAHLLSASNFEFIVDGGSDVEYLKLLKDNESICFLICFYGWDINREVDAKKNDDKCEDTSMDDDAWVTYLAARDCKEIKRKNWITRNTTQPKMLIFSANKRVYGVQIKSAKTFRDLVSILEGCPNVFSTKKADDKSDEKKMTTKEKPAKWIQSLLQN